MPVDDRLLGLVHIAADRIEECERQVEQARREFTRAIRTLYLDGASMREIADAVGLSHQRVHQLLDLPRAPRRGAKARATCSFCGREQTQVKKLICGPDRAGICERCVLLVEQSRAGGRLASDVSTTVIPASNTRCSFCGKRSDDRPPAAGDLQLFSTVDDTGVICADCLDLAQEILREEHADR